MTDAPGIAGIALEELRATAAIEGLAARLVLAGTADTRATVELAEMLKEMHARCTASGVREVEIDFRDLEFMNSSCFKSFVTWIGAIRDLDPSKQYKLTFQSNGSQHWQRRSLDGLACFAVDLITIRS